MAKDYRRRQTRQKRGASSQFFWVLASFLCGYLAATVFDFASLSRWVDKNILAKQNDESPETKVVAKNTGLPKPKFEFYTLLAKDQRPPAPLSKPTQVMQVKPSSPAQPPAASTKAIAPVISAQPTVPVAESKPLSPPNVNKDAYFLQIASFKTRQDAERMKAAFTLKGFDVSVVAALPQQGSWFRVVLGPFHSRLAAEKVQLAIARSEHIKGMIRKIDA